MSLAGQSWGCTSDSPSTILHAYRTYVHPLMEYSCAVFSMASKDLLKKFQSIETKVIKIAFCLPVWTLNRFCYEKVTFTKIADRIQHLSKKFLDKNSSDPLIKEMIESAKRSKKPTPLSKILNYLTKVQCSDSFMNSVVVQCSVRRNSTADVNKTFYWGGCINYVPGDGGGTTGATETASIHVIKKREFQKNLLLFWHKVGGQLE